MPESEGELTRSMEDYLEAIYNLKVRSQVARVKDIAREMKVTMPSVTGAIRSLASRGLVKHQPYETVELTDDGLNHARNIAHRHSAVKEFLMGTLGLKEEDAEREACGIEHAIKPETLEKLLKFVEFVRHCGGNQPFRLDDFRYYLEHGTYPAGSAFEKSPPHRNRHRFGYEKPTITSTRLSDLEPGAKGRIAFVSGVGPMRQRLMEMGVTPDTLFEVVRVAPLGDPIEIKIRGYNLSLRKSEAQHVEVELQVPAWQDDNKQEK